VRARGPAARRQLEQADARARPAPQALLLEADVELWLQQLLAALRRCCRPADSGGASPAGAPAPAAPVARGASPAAAVAAIRPRGFVAPARARPLAAPPPKAAPPAGAPAGAPALAQGRGRGFQGYQEDKQVRVCWVAWLWVVPAQGAGGVSGVSRRPRARTPAPAAARETQRPAPAPPRPQACAAALEAAAAPLLVGHAGRFAQELWAYVQSGLTVAGHDAATFGSGRGPKRRRGGAASSDEGGSEDGSNEGGGESSGGGSSGGGGRDRKGPASSDDEGGGGGRLWDAYGEDLAGGGDY
jgi:hypothetical protein